MTTQKVVLATTDVIDGIKLTRDSLVIAAEGINGDTAPRVNLEHDSHYAPLGKVRAAEVVDLDDQAALVAIKDETHSATIAIHEPTGNRIVELTFPNDERQFVQQERGAAEASLTIAVDNANFDNFKDLNRFLHTGCKKEDNVSTSMMVRRDLTPEPLIQFGISDVVLIGVLIWSLRRGEKFLRYTIDETARKTGDAISDKLSEKIKKLLGVYDEHRSADTREVTSQIIINVEPQINLLTRCHEIGENTEIGIESLCRQMELHQDLLEGADSVTFARTSKDDEWKFLYATTKSGKVVASEDCYADTLRRREEIARTFPVCLCLEHKLTKEERHFETTALATPLDDQGRFQFRFNSVPDDLEEYELTQVSLMLDKKTGKAV